LSDRCVINELFIVLVLSRVLCYRKTKWAMKNVTDERNQPGFRPF